MATNIAKVKEHYFGLNTTAKNYHFIQPERQENYFYYLQKYRLLGGWLPSDFKLLKI